MAKQTYDEVQAIIQTKRDSRTGAIGDDSRFVCEDMSHYWTSIIERNPQIAAKLKEIRSQKEIDNA